jgi:hypothetical protein
VHYSGRLSVPNQGGPGLRVDLEVVDRHLLVSSDGEHLGRYPLTQTLVERVSGNRFRLTIGNEVLDFAAEDAIGFSYEAMPAIAQSVAPMRPKMFLDLMTRRPRRRVTLEHPPTRRASPIPLEEMAQPFAAAPEEDLHIEQPMVEVVDPEPVAVPPLPPPTVIPEASLPVEVVEVVEVAGSLSIIEEPEVSEDSGDLVVEPIGADMATVEACRGVRGDGTPCGSVAVGISGFCFAHDPELAGERKLMTERVNITAQRARATDPDLEALVVRLESAVTQVHEGTLDPQQALAMASLVQAMCDTIGVARKKR